MTTELTRLGTFRQEDAQALEGRLRALAPVQAYLTEAPDGMLFIFPNTLATAERTTAQAIVNAHVAITDQMLLTPLQRGLVAYVKLSSPTAAQTAAAVKALCKVALRLTFKDTADGVDVTQ